MQERLRTTRTVVAVGLTAMLGVIGFLAGSSIAGGAASTTAAVSLKHTRLGPILVSSRGHTLYLFLRDRNGRSTCYGACARFWPPLLTRGRPTAGPGVNRLLLGTTRRSNGSMQVTYRRHPLYTYTRDKFPGQTTGEGSVLFGAKWWAVSARGTAVVRAPSTTTTSSTTTTTCAYPPCP